jgi:hypothetical protein
MSLMFQSFVYLFLSTPAVLAAARAASGMPVLLQYLW